MSIENSIYGKTKKAALAALAPVSHVPDVVKIIMDLIFDVRYETIFNELKISDDLYTCLLSSHTFPSSVARKTYNYLMEIYEADDLAKIDTTNKEFELELIWHSYLEYKELGFCYDGNSPIDNVDYVEYVDSDE